MIDDIVNSNKQVLLNRIVTNSDVMSGLVFQPLIDSIVENCEVYRAADDSWDYYLEWKKPNKTVVRLFIECSFADTVRNLSIRISYPWWKFTFGDNITLTKDEIYQGDFSALSGLIKSYREAGYRSRVNWRNREIARMMKEGLS